MEEEEKTSFSLRSGTDSFVSRSLDVFASLGALEDKHAAFLKATASSRDKDDTGLIKHDPGDEDDDFSAHTGRKSEDSCTEGSRRRQHLSETRESDYEPRSHSRSPNRSGDMDAERSRDWNFKRPSRPPQKLNRQQVPDFKKHPEKYTHYTLEDISDKDMSERTNQRAAYEFLEGRKLERERQRAESSDEEQKFDVNNAACSQGKITFSHKKQNKNQSNEAEKSFTKNTTETPARHLILQDAVDNDLEDAKAENVPKEAELEESLPETSTGSATFKSRKNVKRHIRSKGSNGDSD